MTSPRPSQAPAPVPPVKLAPIEGFRSQPAPERARWLLVALALTLAVAAFVQVLVAHETAVTRWLWAVSMVLLMVSQVRRPTGRPDWRAWLPLLIILVAAAWMRLFRLGEIPDQFHGDIASWGLAARDYLAGRQSNLFAVSWAEIPALIFWQTSLAMRAFGDNLFGLAMHSVIHGLLSILGVYLLANELFDRRVGLLAAALLAISYVHIHFSRIPGSIAPLTTATFTFYFLARGLRSGRRLAFVLAGITLGLGLQDYFNVRIVPVLLVVFLAWIAWRQPDVWRRQRAGLVWLGLGFFVASGPFLAFALRAPAQFMGRGNVVTLFNPAVMTHLQGKYGLDTTLGVWLENTRRTALMFSVFGDTSGHSPLRAPFADMATAALLVVGLAMAVRWIGQPRFALLAAWLASVMFLGGVVTNDPPFWPHLTILLIPMAALAATAIDRTWQAVADGFGDIGDRIAAILVVSGLIYLGLGNFVLYVEQARHTATPLVHAARFIAQTEPQTRILLVPDPWRSRERELDFMRGERVVTESEADELLAADPATLSGAVIILTPNHADLLAALRARLPAAQVRTHRTGAGELAFTTVTVPPSQAAVIAPGASLPPYGYRFVGDTSSRVWEIDVDTVTVRNGRLAVRVAPLDGYGAVYDYLRLVAPDGSELRFEAEGPQTGGDPAYASREGIDGHWWLQRFEPFSGGLGLVAQADEGAPALTTVVTAPDGVYRLLVGSFTGDPNNGVFALQVEVSP